MSAPYVMQVFFSSDRCADRYVPSRFRNRFDEGAVTEQFGMPPVVHNGRQIGRWAIDCVTCTDERWLLFGPFATAASAQDAFKRMDVPEEGRYGFRLWREHCFPESMRELVVWTDG